MKKRDYINLEIRNCFDGFEFISVKLNKLVKLFKKFLETAKALKVCSWVSTSWNLFLGGQCSIRKEKTAIMKTGKIFTSLDKVLQ